MSITRIVPCSASLIPGGLSMPKQDGHAALSVTYTVLYQVSDSDGMFSINDLQSPVPDSITTPGVGLQVWTAGATIVSTYSNLAPLDEAFFVALSGTTGTVSLKITNGKYSALLRVQVSFIYDNGTLTSTIIEGINLRVVDTEFYFRGVP